MYAIRASSRYRSSYKHTRQWANFAVGELNTVINALARGEKLSAKYRDHELRGGHSGIRECHIKNDLLLLYQKHDNALVLLLVDIGTHSSLFKK